MRIPIRVASFNIANWIPTAEQTEDLNDLCNCPDLEVAGLQEIKYDLRSRLPAGWDTQQDTSSMANQKDPIIWRTNLWELVDSGVVLGAYGVDSTDGTRSWPKRMINYAVLRHKATNRIVKFANFHLNAGAYSNGSPRTDSHAPAAEANYEVLQNVKQLHADLNVTYTNWPFVVFGDFNIRYHTDEAAQHYMCPYDNLKNDLGMNYCWEKSGPQSTRSADPENDAKCIDYVLTDTLDSWGAISTPYKWSSWGDGEVVNSDHIAVLANINWDWTQTPF